jgi:hypothetical protein
MDQPHTALSRRSPGLSPAHRELIRLLAEIAVADYLDECEASTSMTETDEHQEVAR